MLRPVLVITAAALLGACAASGPADGGGTRPKPGAQPPLAIAAYLDSAALHQALLKAPPVPPEVTRRTLYLVEFDSTGALDDVTTLFRHNAPVEYVQLMERVLRAHVKPQAPNPKPVHTILWLTSGPGAAIRPVNNLVEIRPTLRNTERITAELEQSIENLMNLNPILAGQRRTAVVTMRVDDQGIPSRATFRRSAGDARVDREIVRIATMMRFTPAAIEEYPVAVLVELPISMHFPAPPAENTRDPRRRTFRE